MNNKPTKNERIRSILYSILLEGWHQGKMQSKTPYDYTLGTDEIEEYMRHKQDQIYKAFGEETLYEEMLKPVNVKK